MEPALRGGLLLAFYLDRAVLDLGPEATVYVLLGAPDSDLDHPPRVVPGALGVLRHHCDRRRVLAVAVVWGAFAPVQPVGVGGRDHVATPVLVPKPIAFLDLRHADLDLHCSFLLLWVVVGSDLTGLGSPGRTSRASGRSARRSLHGRGRRAGRRSMRPRSRIPRKAGRLRCATIRGRLPRTRSRSAGSRRHRGPSCKART